MSLTRAHELPHAFSAPDWSEHWGLAVVDPGSATGLVVAYRRSAVSVSVAAAVVTAGDRVVALVADDLVVPRAGYEVRGPGIWADLVCEEPGARWTLGLEAMAVTLDDPRHAVGHGRGDPTPLGWDLDLDDEPGPDLTPATGPGSEGGAYGRGCRVRGEVLVGAGSLEIDGWGRRHHSWGPGAVPLAGRFAWVGVDAAPRHLVGAAVPDASPLAEVWLPGPIRHLMLAWGHGTEAGVGWSIELGERAGEPAPAI
ncbi:MAG TPA: hypothetical protein VK866_13875 [Acidimicrobiales bacterium]|nr:hypothetical protein [Acidimicrobiales bacterium]